MKNTDRYFLSSDWGTSSFRLKIIERETGSVLSAVNGDEGIKKVYNRWIAYDGPLSRIEFYLDFLQEKIVELEERSQNDLSGLPLVTSGMASSSIGIQELPYRPLPLALDNPKLNVETFEATSRFPHELFLVSGIRSSEDVMRGEETQLLGLSSILDISNGCFLLTGTHCKHVFIEEGVLTAFKTYMTGELFELIASQSILSDSIVARDQSTPGPDFEKGVAASQDNNMLHSLFTIRVRDLLQDTEKTGNFDYLSGLLIGHELKDIATNLPKNIILWGSAALQTYYEVALDLLGLNYLHPDFESTKDITSAGHQIILNQMNN